MAWIALYRDPAHPIPRYEPPPHAGSIGRRVEQLHPAISHCFEVSDTNYKLIVEDRAGHAVTQSLIIQVGR
jgi:hypothetical protein